MSPDGSQAAPQGGGTGLRVAVVMISIGQWPITRDCIESLAAGDRPPDHVILIDNAAGDGSAEAARAHSPAIEVLPTQDRLGFAAAANLGMRRALDLGYDLVWLLNNDTIASPGAFRILVERMTLDPGIGVSTPKIRYHQPPDILWYAGGDVRLDRPAGVIHRGFGHRDEGQHDADSPITFVSGCAPLIRRSVLESVGMLTEDLFMYAEDLDYSVRLQRAGVRSVCVGAALIWHRIGQSFGGDRQSPSRIYMMTRGRFWVQRRYRRWPASALVCIVYLASPRAWPHYRRLLGGDAAPARAMLRGIVDGLRGLPYTNLSPR